LSLLFIFYEIDHIVFKNLICLFLHKKNDFTEGSKILLDTENNFVKALKIMSDAAKNFELMFERSTYYFDSSTKLLFGSVSS